MRGIVIHDVAMLVSQYADDTTVFLDEDLNSFNYAVRILKWFEKRSGLAINNEKQKLSNLGLKRQEHTLAGEVWFRMDNYIRNPRNHL